MFQKSSRAKDVSAKQRCRIVSLAQGHKQTLDSGLMRYMTLMRVHALRQAGTIAKSSSLLSCGPVTDARIGLQHSGQFVI